MDAVNFCDAELLKRAGHGDHEAFGQLYDRHAGPAYALAVHLSGDRQAAEDLVQEAFLALWRRWERFDPERGSLRNWLLTILRHRSVDELRRRSAHQRRDARLKQIRYVSAEGEDALIAYVDRRVVAEPLRRQLLQLPREQLETLLLTHYTGLTQIEIARHMGVPLGTVKSRLRLALARLAGSAADYGHAAEA